MKVLVAQNRTLEKNQEFGKKGSELDSRRNVTSNCCRQLLERTSRTLRGGLRPPEADNSQQERGGAFVGIKGQKNKTGRRVCFSHLRKCWQQSQIRIFLCLSNNANALTLMMTVNDGQFTLGKKSRASARRATITTLVNLLHLWGR